MANNSASYILQCRRLLHDSTGQFYQDSELNDYINDARLRVVRDTGCLRTLLQVSIISNAVITGSIAGNVLTVATIISGGAGVGITGAAIGVNQTVTGTGVLTSPPTVITSQLTGVAGGVGTYQVTNSQTITLQQLTLSPVEKYPYASYTDPLLPTGQTTIDVLNINIIWGNSRFVVDYLPWSRFNYWLRGWTMLQGRPIVFSNYGQNSVYLGPAPDQFYITEWDLVVTPVNFISPADTTLDTIPIPFQNPVPYYACFTAKQRMQEWEEADRFERQYRKQLMSALNSAYTRRLTRVI